VAQHIPKIGEQVTMRAPDGRLHAGAVVQAQRGMLEIHWQTGHRSWVPSVQLSKPPANVGSSSFLAIAAIVVGFMALAQGAIKGQSAGWELMMAFTGPAVFCALCAVALRRSALTYAGLVFGVLAVVGLLLGA
jgi:hypothetical protein